MTVETTVGDIDIRTVMAALKGYDKQLQRNTVRTIRRSAAIIVRDARAGTPTEPPMSGWRTVPATNGRTRGGRGWPAWVNVRQNIRSRFGRQTRIRETGQYRWDLVRIVQTSPSGQVYEFARNGQTRAGQQFVDNLNRDRNAPRAIWPAVDKHRADVERDVMRAVEDAAAAMNRKLQ